MVGEMGDEQRRELLCFWTSMSTVPAGTLHPTAVLQHVLTTLDKFDCSLSLSSYLVVVSEYLTTILACTGSTQLFALLAR